MAKCGIVYESRVPAACAREAHDPSGTMCCPLCSTGLHTPECWIRTYPELISAEYFGSPTEEVDIIERLTMAISAVRIVQKEVTTINRLIWNLQMGHKHRTLQSLLHHLEVDLRYIDQEIKGITG